jgi:putative flippase GtrA
MTAILTNPLERTRFLKFVAVGAFGFLIDFGVFNLLYTILRMNPVVSQIISFCMAVVSNFIWNRYWTYPESRTKPLGRQISQFALVNIAGLLIRTAIFAMIEPFLDSEFQTLHTANYGLDPNIVGHNISLATVVIIVMLWNFFVNRYWTYNDIDKQAE